MKNSKSEASKTVIEKVNEYLVKNRNRWIPKWELESLSFRFHCLSETITRKARRLEETSAYIDKKLVNGIVHYKLKT